MILARLPVGAYRTQPINDSTSSTLLLLSLSLSLSKINYKQSQQKKTKKQTNSEAMAAHTRLSSCGRSEH